MPSSSRAPNRRRPTRGRTSGFDPGERTRSREIGITASRNRTILELHTHRCEAGRRPIMTNPVGSEFGDDAPEADVVEQLIPIDVTDEDTWRDAARVASALDWEASEADMIAQAIAVPDDDSEFDR